VDTRDEVPLELGRDLEVRSPYAIHPDHAHGVVVVGLADAKDRSDADEEDDREDDEREEAEALTELGCLRNERESDDGTGDGGEEHRRAAERLVLTRASVTRAEAIRKPVR
jgi:hypothetical protein